MASIRMANLEDYELHFDGVTAALYTYLLNQDPAYYDVDELRDRLVNDGHELTLDGMTILETDKDGDTFIEWDEFETFKQSDYAFGMKNK